MHQFTSAAALSRRQLFRSGAIMGAGAALTTLPFATPAAAQDAAARWPQVARLVKTYVDRQNVANMVTAMGWRQDDPAFIAQGRTGFDRGPVAGPDTLYRIYSMTKPVTGMAAMICIDEGRFGLDTPLAEILPAYQNMWVQKKYDGAVTTDNLEALKRPILIRHLLTHTAGLGYGIVQSGPIAEMYLQKGLIPGQVSRLEIAGIFRGQPVASLAAFADRLATVPLVLQPGTRWSYSVGLDLMGRVIEVATGQKFDAFLKDRIFDPVGMDSTGFQVSRGDAGRLASNYFFLGGFPIPIDEPENSIYLDKPAFPFGGAGLVSSARDYDRFLQMLAGYGRIDGQQVMSEAAVRMGTSDLFPDTLAPGGGFDFGSRSFGFGAGGMVGRGDADGLFGWFGAAGTAGLVNMKWGLRQTLMAQFMPAERYELRSEFPLAVAADAAAQLPR